jgi:hypothetical protein
LKQIEHRNDVQSELNKNTTKEKQEKGQGRRKAPKREKRRKSKDEMAKKLARGCKDEDFTIAPTEAWKVCIEI